jgi:hypothetical protein
VAAVHSVAPEAAATLPPPAGTWATLQDLLWARGALLQLVQLLVKLLQGWPEDVAQSLKQLGCGGGARSLDTGAAIPADSQVRGVVVCVLHVARRADGISNMLPVAAA